MAAPILSYEGLGLRQGDSWLFRDLDLFIQPRDRMALIGRNGAGKTTLLKCLAGAIEADSGRRTIVPGSRVVLLEQDPALAGFATLRDFTLAGDDAPPVHAVDAIAGQIGIDLNRPAGSASGGGPRSREPWRGSPMSCSSTNRPIISILPRSSGWRTG